MRTAQEASKHFVSWLAGLSHHKPFPNLGVALIRWLECGGFEHVPADYTTFLQVVLVVLSHPDLSTGGFKVRLDRETEVLLLRPEGLEWTASISNDEFNFVLFKYRGRPRR